MLRGEFDSSGNWITWLSKWKLNVKFAFDFADCTCKQVHWKLRNYSVEFSHQKHSLEGIYDNASQIIACKHLSDSFVNLQMFAQCDIEVEKKIDLFAIKFYFSRINKCHIKAKQLKSFTSKCLTNDSAAPGK